MTAISRGQPPTQQWRPVVDADRIRQMVNPKPIDKQCRCSPEVGFFRFILSAPGDYWKPPA
jgi:hypothetical protein